MPAPASWHTAFGLVIGSEVSLSPYLAALGPAVRTRADLEVTLGIPAEVRGSRDLELVWPGVARAVVSAGSLVRLEPQGVDSRVLAELVAGPILALALEQRGAFVLHASAIASGGRAIAFVGRSGAGKSTTAALFAAEGFELLADDLAVLGASEQGVTCTAGPTLAKLDAQLAARIAGVRPVGREATGERMLCEWTRTRGPGEPVPLAAIYVLEDAAQVELAPCRGHEALLELLRHAFCLHASGPARTAARLPACEVIGRHVPIRRLCRPRRLEQRDAVVEAVLADLHQSGVPC